MRVEFPADVREDMRILGGLKLSSLKYLIPAAVFGIVCVMLPFPAPLKLAGLVGLPLGTYLFLFFEVPEMVRRRRSHGKEPAVRTAAETVKNNVQEIIHIKDVSDNFVTTEDQHVHLFLSVTPGAWHTKTGEEKDQAGLAWMQAVARTLTRGMYMMAWSINDLEVLRSELARQEKEQAGLPGPLRAVGQARREYFQKLAEAGISRVSSYYIRISADPFGIELAPRPRSKGERIEKTRQLMAETARDVIEKLQATGAEAVLLSAELVRDLAARQLDPRTYREGPVRGSDWIRPGVPEEGVRAAKEEAKKALGKARPGKAARQSPRLPRIPAPPLAAVALRLARLTRRLISRSSSLSLVVVLQPGQHDAPGLDPLVSVLRRGYETINIITWIYVPAEEGVSAEIKKSMWAELVYVVFPYPDDWRDMDIDAAMRLIQAEARRRGCPVEASLLYASGGTETIATH